MSTFLAALHASPPTPRFQSLPLNLDSAISIDSTYAGTAVVEEEVIDHPAVAF